MTGRSESISCARARALVETYLDAELAAAHRARFETHVQACPSCAAELAGAARLRDGLQALPELRCPATVMTAVLGRIRADEAAGAGIGVPLWHRLMDAADRLGARAVPVWRPALATVSVTALVLLLVLVGRPHRPVAPVGPDVARAELEVKWVMAYLGEIGRHTGTTVREDVIAARVVTPMTQAVESALQSDGTLPEKVR